jgi:hypothetical protein
VTEKTGFPMSTVTVKLSDHAVPPTSSSKTEDNGMSSITYSSATYSILLIDVEKEIARQRIERDEQRLNERTRALAAEAKARGQVAPPPAPEPRPSGPPNNALLPAPPTPAPSLLPGAPQPSVDPEAYAAYAKQFGARLLAEGVRLRNSGAPDAERKTYKLRVQVWRGQMRKLIRDSGNYKATEMLTSTLHEFDDRMRTLGSELGIDDWKDE